MTGGKEELDGEALLTGGKIMTEAKELNITEEEEPVRP